MATYDPNWRQQALTEGRDVNSPEFAEMRSAESIAKGNWQQAALDKGVDVNNPTALTAAGINPSSSSSGSSLSSLTNTSNTPDLASIYKNLYATSGVEGLQTELTSKQTAYNEALSKINDNPFLSEANRVGRAQKLTTDYNNSIATLQNQITSKKSDVDTQMGLATKQIDINNAATTQALNTYNTLLSSGALDNASASDLASISASTGLSTSMIQSAVNAQKQKNVKTQTISYDDGKNQGYAIINSDTGEIISKQTVATSKPSAAEEKAAAGEGGPSKTEIKSAAQGALKAVDTNKDKAVSLDEFASAVNRLMNATGVDYDTAYDAAYQAMTALGFTTWKWSSAK